MKKNYLLLMMLSLSMLSVWADDNITFADETVKAICVANWDTDGDGELSYEEAAAVTDLGDVFRGNTTITSFDELQYFTGVTSIGDYAFDGCGLTSIVIPYGVEVGYAAFVNCHSLRTVTLYTGSISATAFHFCDNISTVYVNCVLALSPAKLFPSSTNINIIYGEGGGYAYAELGIAEDFLNTYESPIDKAFLANAENHYIRIPICIGNSVDISQIQFDFSLPNRFFLLKNENGKKMIEMDKVRFDYDSDFGYSHTMTLTEFDENNYRVLLTNSDNIPIMGNDGDAAVYVTILVNNDINEEGDFEIFHVRNIEFSTPSAEKIRPEEKGKSVKVYLRDSGNFNGDENVSVTDYAGVVRWAAGQGYDDQGVPEWVIKKASDVNEDDEISVTDVSGIVNIILYGNYQGHTSNAKARRAAGTTGASLSIEPFTINRGETKEITVDLSSAYTDLSQCQFDLTLPEGLSLASVNGRTAVYPGELTRLADGYSHTVSSALREDGTVRVVCLSSSNEAYNGTEGSIVRLKVVADKDVAVGTADIELTNVEFAKTDATQLLGIGAMTTVTVGNETNGITSVTDSSFASKDVFSADGIHKDRLSKGLNIVRYADGSIRKVMVK